MRTLTPEVIEQDAQLAHRENRASEGLAKLRWHWTIDPGNAEVVTMRNYAKAVGRAPSTVARYAHGYEAWLADRSMTISDHIAVAAISADTMAAAEAVAEAYGISLSEAQRGHRTEVRQVRETARRRAEERGTTVDEEATRAAETLKGHHASLARRRDTRQSRTELRFVEVEGYLSRAKRQLLKAVKVAPTVEWDDESRELLMESVANVKAILALIESGVNGESGVDWDAALRRVLS